MRYLFYCIVLAAVAFLPFHSADRGRGVALSFSAGSQNDFSGIDVSHHQNIIDWQKVVESTPQLEFVYIKATEGATFQDRLFTRNAYLASKAGLKVGGYHVFRTTSSAHKQFENFKRMLSDSHIDLIPMVDANNAGSRYISEARDSLKVLLGLIENHYGVKPMIYVGASGSSLCYKLTGYPIYLRGIGSKKPPQNVVKEKYTLWQFSCTGNIEGIEKEVDLCRFNPEKSLSDILLQNDEIIFKTTENNR